MPVETGGSGPASTCSWRETLAQRLPLFGHRNWIVIADSAYPAQSRPGVETIAAPAGQLEVVAAVLAGVAASKHVRAAVYLDQELDLVPEGDAPGVSAYRRELSGLLKDAAVRSIPHAELIARLDKAARLFNVLIIKTTLCVPYTSVFLELDCGYWSADAERRLREAGKDPA